MFARVSCFVSPRKGEAPLRLSTRDNHVTGRKRVEVGGWTNAAV